MCIDLMYWWNESIMYIGEVCLFSKIKRKNIPQMSWSSLEMSWSSLFCDTKGKNTPEMSWSSLEMSWSSLFYDIKRKKNSTN